MPRYNPAVVEPKWQKFWKENQTFKTPDMPQGEKVYVLDMFPYPSGDGLHVGHPEGYTATDITCRFHRMRGKTVLHPMGFDAFGLPAEEHAIKFGQHPAEFTAKNIANFKRQLQALGFSYDWDREISTTDPEYVRWTQWIFTVAFDTWFDVETQKGRPISELPIPPAIQALGEDAVRRYQDSKRLAYINEAPVNWCPALGTVLANEEVVGGVSERGHHPVVRLPLKQWMFRITAYADRLEAGLDSVNWPDSVKHLQRNWIGRSTGAEVDFFIGAPAAKKVNGAPIEAAFEAWKAGREQDKFPLIPGADVLRIYTTRPDTLFGATYMVVAPEHAFVDRLTTPEQAEAVQAYREAAAAKSELDRTSLNKTKSGVFTGSYAINPVNGNQVPIWVADYVLAGYGTGAIMAVPAHDERDFEFAQQFGLPVIAVVDPGPGAGAARQAMLLGEQQFVADGIAINSGVYNGLATPEFKTKIVDDLAHFGVARGAVNYKLRDWLFSRQRFWGEPFPILHELGADGLPNGLMRTVPDDQLPVLLPAMADYKPHGRPEPMLAKAPDDWLYVTLDGKRYKRELNTMPQWAGSCWYFLRFIDPKNDKAFIDPAKEKAWMPVDLYIGGAEHAVLHLLYSRFWHQVLFDRGHVSCAEPFTKLVNQGMILGEPEYTGFQRETGEWLGLQDTRESEDQRYAKKGGDKLTPVKLGFDQVEKSGDSFILKDNPQIRVESRSYKMSKSRGNVINPDDVVREYGADALRLYEMFMGPLEATKPWSMAGVNGVRGFLDRGWRMIVDQFTDEMSIVPAVSDRACEPEEEKFVHKTIQAVTQDIERLSFNTAIARLMEFVNFFTKLETRPRSALDRFVLLLAPFAPHTAEELWEQLGHGPTLAYEPWPTFDAALVKDDEVEIPVSILGKVRGKIVVPAGADAATIEAAAKADAKIAAQLEGKTIVKVIAVPGRMVNFVVK